MPTRAQASHGVARASARIVRLTLLAPDIVEAILDGPVAGELQLNELLEGFRRSGEAQQQG